MNTTTNTRVSEAMVERAITAAMRQCRAEGVAMSDKRWDSQFPSAAAWRAALEAALSAEPAAQGGAVGLTSEDVSDLHGLIRVMDNFSKKRAPDPNDLDAEFFVTANINHVAKSMECWLPIVKRIHLNAYRAQKAAYLNAKNKTSPTAAPSGQAGPLISAANNVFIAKRKMDESSGQQAIFATRDYELSLHSLGVAVSIAEKALTAPPAQPAERVPAGWVLVPREPTAAMLDAALKLHGDDAFLARAPVVLSAFVKFYHAMLAATPAAPAEEGDGKEGVR